MRPVLLLPSSATDFLVFLIQRVKIICQPLVPLTLFWYPGCRLLLDL